MSRNRVNEQTTSGSFMHFKLYTDINEFYDDTYDVLIHDESHNIILLGKQHEMSNKPRRIENKVLEHKTVTSNNVLPSK